MKQFNRKPLSSAISLAIAGTALAAMVILPAHAEEGALEEVTVTATKRTANLQDIPVSIQVLGAEQLQELEIKGFDDYITWMPTVSYQSNGPGYGIVYMRGIASGGDGNHSGSQPSVGMYLDEQPITTINQILNVHVYDVARIETLAGPQGTLFGQGSQAGTIRIITNKPEIGVSEGGYDFYANNTAHGDPGYGIEGFINIPINDRMAVRLVAWHDYQGGYIDNVHESFVYAISGIVRDNADLVEDNFNTAETTGLRSLLKIDLSDTWTLTPGIQYQKGETNGIWQDNPKYADEYEVERFNEDKSEQDWYQATLTLDGEIGNMNLVYAGAYLDRDVDSTYDYAGYAEHLEDKYSAYYYYDENGDKYYLECFYYQVDGSCADSTQYVVAPEEFTRFSNELRLQSSQDQRLRWIAGLFYQRQEHYYDLQWTVDELNPAKSVVEGGGVVWQTNQDRVDKDYAAFGEAYFDITDNWTLTGGVRWFKWDNSLYGFNGLLRHCTGYYDENGKFVQATAANGGTPQYPCYNTGILDAVSKGKDTAWKGSAEYHIDGEKMVYATYSEGFRAGGVNRARVAPGKINPQYEPDWVYNYEVGWKTTWADGQFRFNGALYIEDWKDFQYGFLDFAAYGPLTVIQNVGDARTKGIEWQMEWAPTDSFSLSFQGSYNDAKLQTDFWRTQSEYVDGLPPNSPKGTEMPYVPPLQMTSIGRYNFTMGELASFAQVAVSYRASTWASLDSRDDRPDPNYGGKMPAYTVLNLSTGFERDNWSLTFYVNNVTDKRGLTDKLNPGYYSPSGFDYNQVIIQPRNFGIRWTQRFEGGYEEASSPPPAPPPPPPAAPPENPDLDGDGVPNARDKCPDTRPGAVVDLDGCEVEAVISLEGVHFEFDQATLTAEAMAILDKAAGLLATQEKVVVEVAGHTDSVGSEEYNQKLSERRAIAVKDYLESKGITATRMTAMGYGEAQPVASNDTDEGRAQNRRVELIVLDR